jgi:hypothetical protein
MIHSRLARRIDTGNHELFADSANLDLTSRAAVYGELVEPRERARLEGETARIESTAGTPSNELIGTPKPRSASADPATALGRAQT